MSDEITVKDGFIYGAWRKAVNASMTMRGSIHDDSVGRSVGMRGGVVAGTVHLDLFPPVALHAFGPRWFEQGSVSMFYLYALLHDEEVRVVIKVPPKDARDVQVEAYAETPGGRRVMEGTVSLGNPKELSHLRAMELKSSPQEELRILKNLKPGMELKPRNTETVTREEAAGWQTRLEDWLDWYGEDSPWGGFVVPPSRTAGLMQVYPGWQLQAVPFYGATEIRYFNGPVKVGVPYRVSGKAVCVGTGGRTEYFWTDSELHEKESGKLVARMLHMHRLMKVGSPLYPEIKQTS